jgi:hypothetical protein
VVSPFGFSAPILYAFLFPPVNAKCPAHLILLEVEDEYMCVCVCVCVSVGNLEELLRLKHSEYQERTNYTNGKQLEIEKTN